MPCYTAIAKKNITALQSDTVEDVLKKIKKSKVEACAIIDDDGKFIGLFSMKVLLNSLIPVCVAMSDGIEIDVKVTAAPGVAKRLENSKLLPVLELMNRKPVTILPDTPIWEGVSLITKKGEPLSVVDSNGKFIGFITYESLVNDLENIKSADS